MFLIQLFIYFHFISFYPWYLLQLLMLQPILLLVRNLTIWDQGALFRDASPLECLVSHLWWWSRKFLLSSLLDRKSRWYRRSSAVPFLMHRPGPILLLTDRTYIGSTSLQFWPLVLLRRLLGFCRQLNLLQLIVMLLFQSVLAHIFQAVIQIDDHFLFPPSLDPE